jgi:uncharacterized repeat protein (TIGR01451 family)
MNTNTASNHKSTSPVRRTARFLAGALFASTVITSASAMLSGNSAQALCPPPCFVPMPIPTPITPVFDPTLIDLIHPVFAVRNLRVTINNSRTAVVPGDNPIYTITVRNLWTSPANGVSVLNNVPGGLSGLVWSCNPGVGSSCTNVNGSGAITQTINIGAESYVAFTTSSLVNSSSAAIANSVTIVPPAAFGDNNAADNAAVDTDTVTLPTTTTTTAAPAPAPAAPAAPAAPGAPAAPAATPSTTTPAVILPPPLIVDTITTTTVAPAPTTTQAPTPTQPQTIVVIVKQEAPAAPAATPAAQAKASAKKIVAKKTAAKKVIARKALRKIAKKK